MAENNNWFISFISCVDIIQTKKMNTENPVPSNVGAATRIHTSTPLGKVSADAAKYVQQPTWVEWWKQKVSPTRRKDKKM